LENEIEKFVHPVGKEAGKKAIEKYKASDKSFEDSWVIPMMYTAGFTTSSVTHAFTNSWIIPLQKRLRNTGIALVVTAFLFVGAILYGWSLVSPDTFYSFLLAFVPAIVALLYTLAKSYKTWAEAKRALAEALKIENEATIEKNNFVE
jgi:hypothetical protein